MTEHKKTKTPKNWLNIALCAFVVISVGVAGFLAWKGYDLEQKSSQVLQAIDTQKQTLLELEAREQIGERIKAAELLTKAQEYRINWSQAVQDLESTFSKRDQINFKQVTILPSGEVSVQAEAKDLLSAASFLVLVNRSELFENGFIGDITSKGGNAQNQTYGFSATFNYLAAPSS